MILSDIDICNQALTLCGGSTISSLSDGSAEAVQCGQHYETTVRACLTAPGGAPFRWSFASRQEQLSRLADTPADRWTYAYQLPPEMLAAHGAVQNGHLVEYAIYGDKLFTDAEGPIVLDHSFRAEASAWPPFFVEAVVATLATKLALALNRDGDLAKLVRPDWQGARTADSQQRTAMRMRATRLTSARFTSRATFR
jgi:hypothetical protein